MTIIDDNEKFKRALRQKWDELRAEATDVLPPVPRSLRARPKVGQTFARPDGTYALVITATSRTHITAGFLNIKRRRKFYGELTVVRDMFSRWLQLNGCVPFTPSVGGRCGRKAKK